MSRLLFTLDLSDPSQAVFAGRKSEASAYLGAGIALEWLTTPPLSWILAFQADLGAFGRWVAITIEIVIGAILFWRRLWRGGWRAAAARSRETVLAAATQS